MLKNKLSFIPSTRARLNGERTEDENSNWTEDENLHSQHSLSKWRRQRWHETSFWQAAPLDGLGDRGGGRKLAPRQTRDVTAMALLQFRSQAREASTR